jgi:protein tyrosine/serine phosphatase
MRKPWRRAAILSLAASAVISLAAACAEPAEPKAATVRESAPGARDPRWAVPLSEPGLPNLHRIDAGLYRGAQPDEEGFSRLRAMGVRTVVNLRSMHSDRDEIRAAGLPEDAFRYVSIPMAAWAVEDEHVIAFLKVANDPASRPVFFHCQHGADRTGTMAAAYRVAVEGWSREDASREMTEGGYGFHGVWVNLLEYMNALDVERLRAAAGIE